MVSIVDDFIEISFKQETDFLKIRETLTRIGIPNKEKTELYQSVYILHKRGKYYLVHFKQLLQLDGKQVSISEEDIARRNTIANLLFAWGMCSPVKADPLSPLLVAKGNFTVIPFHEKRNWKLIPKYTLGTQK